MGAYSSEWRRLYSYARLTRKINPSMRNDVLSGRIKPHIGINSFIDRHYDRAQKEIRESLALYVCSYCGNLAEYMEDLMFVWVECPCCGSRTGDHIEHYEAAKEWNI